MFISDMKNPFLLLFLLAFGSFGCKEHAIQGSSDKIQAVTLTEDSVKPAEVIGLDSSMVNLKTYRSIPLEMLLAQKWNFEDADQDHWNEIFWDSVTDTRQYPELSLFEDHSAVLNPRCGIKIGKWSLNKDTRELGLHFKDGSSRVFHIRQMNLKQLELGLERKEGDVVVRLKSDGLIEKDVSRDPYYPPNLVWWQKPKALENEAQLRARIHGCVHFFALYFADNHNRQATTIPFDGFPSCFVWYNGGIGLQEKTDLDVKWINCFYSEKQARTAYDMVGAELSKHTLKWPEHPTSWVEQTGQVLGQLAERFKD